ncbi:hypothetical protein RJ639_037969 [Escallonia herrerae]|uniref:Uncharacterized protein n=1 Tax=Escallonia herrerae TaxID=1293975 RepID=A0AA88WLD1_9ASTE|nr:hypothetical protein RJ639_037969 [Escallonia herrerae]
MTPTARVTFWEGCPILFMMCEIKYTNSSANELWDALDSKYKMEDARNKKFFINNLFDFRMIDNKSVITQIHELQMIMNIIILEGHSLNESFQVPTIISKLPLAWKECRKELKQKKDAMTIQELVRSLTYQQTLMVLLGCLERDMLLAIPNLMKSKELTQLGNDNFHYNPCGRYCISRRGLSQSIMEFVIAAYQC